VTTKEMATRVWYWQRGGDNFTSLLFTLYRKADPENATKLLCAFPEEIKALNEWLTSETPRAFYARYGIDDTAEEHK
jgi:hypothetical protein